LLKRASLLHITCPHEHGLTADRITSYVCNKDKMVQHLSLTQATLQSATQFIAANVMNLVTIQAAAELELFSRI
jgi:hypothetical protein